jgi:diaminopimelate epimerase
MTTFLKMHGLGNDFVIFDARIFPLPLDPITAKAISDRKRGIGCDQVIVMEPAKNGAAAFMRIFNADGREVESCGNAARCVAYLLMAERESDHMPETSAAPFSVRRSRQCGDRRYGPPAPDCVKPMAKLWTGRLLLPVPGFDEAALQSAVALDGQPHCVLFVKDAEAAPWQLGAAIEHHPWFPSRTNVEFVERQAILLRMRTPTGAGITSPAARGCAAVVAAVCAG